MTLKLKRWKRQPEKSSNDETIGQFIMIFLNATFMIMIAYFGYFLYFSHERSYKVNALTEVCGPYISMQYPMSRVEAFLFADSNISTKIYNMLTKAQFILILMAFVISLIYRAWRYIRLY